VGQFNSNLVLFVESRTVPKRYVHEWRSGLFVFRRNKWRSALNANPAIAIPVSASVQVIYEED
jgi:hypothetical protein